jgi:hypothetical protein
MWPSFHWHWNNKADVKKFVSKELGKRYNLSKRSFDKKQAKLATRDVANAASSLPNAPVALVDITNPHPQAVGTDVANPSTIAVVAGAASHNNSVSSEISAACPSSEPAPVGSSCSSGFSGPFDSPPAGASSNPDASWTDPDFNSARAFMGDAFWYAADYAIATNTSGAFNHREPVPAGVLLQDWMFNVSFVITS